MSEISSQLGAIGKTALPALPETEEDGRLVENIMFFARTLRAAGLPVGPGKVLDAIKAVEAVGIRSRGDFYWTLHAVFVNRRDQRELFNQAFHVFWQNPRILEKMMAMVLPEFRGALRDEEKQEEMSRRVAEALTPERAADDATGGEQEEELIEFDAALTWSDEEKLQKMDFEKMSAEEVAKAKAAIASMRLPLMDVPTRRFSPSQRGNKVDLRRTLKATVRTGGDQIPLMLKKQKTRHPPLVTLCDISGSMSRYSRMLLHFMHAITNDRDRVHTFLFGTRLTNISRYLKQKDVDEALTKIGDTVEDWSGGTRIGSCLEEFNRVWARRVLGQGALVLLITDGLDREGGEGLAKEMDRLHRSCRRLVWLNPLLRYDGFAPKSLGVRAILPHVDDFKSVHSLESLEQLVEAIGRTSNLKGATMSGWLDQVRAIEDEARATEEMRV